MSRLGRHRLPAYMQNPPGYVLQQLGITWGQWTAPELLTAMAYRDAAVLERETWDEELLDVDAFWSRTACTRWGDLYVGKAAFIVGVGCDPAGDGVLHSMIEPVRQAELQGRFGRPAGEGPIR